MKNEIARFFVEEYQLTSTDMVRRSMEKNPRSDDSVEALLMDADGELRWHHVGFESDCWIDTGDGDTGDGGCGPVGV